MNQAHVFRLSGRQRTMAALAVSVFLAACGGATSEGAAPAEVAAAADTERVSSDAVRRITARPRATAPAPAPAPSPAAPTPPPPPPPAAPPPPPPAPAAPRTPPPPPPAAPAPPPAAPAPSPVGAPGPVSQLDAVRLADQASFGPTEALVSQIRSTGLENWISAQMRMSNSRYTGGGNEAYHQNIQDRHFCERPPHGGPNCWRDWGSSAPLLWDFARNAVGQPDQLRQRVAFALKQIFVVSNVDVNGTYGLRNYHNMLLNNSFGNYRDLLKGVTLSPVMGDYLNHVNNDRAAPNENFARELLQLFTIGTCELNLDGTWRGGSCTPTYDNRIVREYAYSLTGWTYPLGGSSIWGCWPLGTNCPSYNGNMVPAAANWHDPAQRQLLSGVTKPGGSNPASALESVLDSVMAHPNLAPFVTKQLIQFLVSSNPSREYVARVSNAFNSGRFTASQVGMRSNGTVFGNGRRGDLSATVAAILLDPEARRTANAGPNEGRLRDPMQAMLGVVRALNGFSDGEGLGWWWGEAMGQHVFRAPSVFNFYPPDYPVPGTDLVGPAFGVLNASTGLARLNYLAQLIDWGGVNPVPGIPNATGTRVNLDPFLSDAGNPAALVDRLSNLATGGPLPATQRDAVIRAVQWWTPQNRGDWAIQRVRAAAYLVFASPNYQVQR